MSAEQRQALRRAQLVRAGRILYARHGFAGTSVKAICKQAQLTERYFYESFPNDESLFLVVCQEVTRECIAQYRTARDLVGSNPIERVRAVLLAYYGGIRDEAASARVILIEAPTVSAESKSAWKACRDELGAVLMECWEENRAQTPAPEARPVAAAVRQIAIDWIENDFAEPLEAAVDLGMKMALVLQP